MAERRTRVPHTVGQSAFPKGRMREIFCLKTSHSSEWVPKTEVTWTTTSVRVSTHEAQHCSSLDQQGVEQTTGALHRRSPAALPRRSPRTTLRRPRAPAAAARGALRPVPGVPRRGGPPRRSVGQQREVNGARINAFLHHSAHFH